jgi:YfiR/HmsC-like
LNCACVIVESAYQISWGHVEWHPGTPFHLWRQGNLFLRMSLSPAFGVIPRRRVRPSFPAPWIACAVAACLISVRVLGQTNQLRPSEVKAGFLVNLVKFVEWPDATFASDREPIVFGIVGTDPLANALNQAVYGQSVRGRTLAVRKYNFGDDLRSCQVLFVSASEQGHLPQILAGVLGASVLTVSDAQRFAEAGGVVQFAVDEDRVHFSVNRDAAIQAKLQISAKLLTLSRAISGTGILGTK